MRDRLDGERGVRVALSAAPAENATAWMTAQWVLASARAAGEAPLLRTVRPHGSGWATLSFWGMRFAPPVLRGLEADPAFVAARERGDVGVLVEPSDAPAPLWLVALAELSRPPMYLPPLVSEVVVPLHKGTARYRFETMVFALAPRAAD